MKATQQPLAGIVLLPLLCFTLFVCLPSACQAQQLTWEAFLESLADERTELSETQEASWDAFLEEIEQQHENPIELNQATRDDLRMLYFLSDEQIEAILNYRAEFGPILTMGELLFIEEIDWDTRQLLYLFAHVDPPSAADRRKSFSNAIRHEGSVRIDIPLYQRAGWPWQRGLANQWRWDTKWNHYQAGIRAETDAGEYMFNRQIKGWDSMGGYAMASQIGWLHTAIVGDYKLHFGEGVALSNAFQVGKAGLGNWHTAKGLRPHRSADEINFMRGAAVSIQPAKQWQLTAFYSIRRLDATLQADNTVQTIAKSGLHRSTHEMEQRKALTGQAAGAHAAWESGPWGLGVTGLYQYYDHLLSRGKALYQQINPEGYQFGVVSADYSYRHYPLYIHGETARSLGATNGAWGTSNQLSWRINANVQLSVAQRFYGKRYFSPYANSFAENGQVRNESGVCILFDAKRLGPFSISSFADFFYSPWPRYTMTRQSRGGEGMLQACWALSPTSTSVTLRYQVKSKERSDRRYWSHRLRATLEKPLSPIWLLRASALYHLYAMPNEQNRCRHSTGLAANIMARYAPTRTPWRCSIQGSWFHTDDFYSRIYAAEPRIQGSFAIPSFYGHGLRLAGIARWQWAKRWTLQALLGCTRYFDRNVISNGPLQIRSSWKTDLSILTRIKL